MEPLHFDKISVDAFSFAAANKNNIDLFLLRLDRIHAAISGNKWFKLKFYLDDAIALNKKTIITFGGAWSNHILATAAACKLTGLHAVGIIRGEQPAHISYTLKAAADNGMKLIFVSREDYAKKIMPPGLADATDDHYIINEGGYGDKGVAGAATIEQFYQKDQFSHICCAVGTGTMMTGLIKSSLQDQVITGISVLKNNFAILNNLEALLSEKEQQKKYSIIHDYHFGGYAKMKPPLIDFMNQFYKRTNIPTDFVYTGKLLYGIDDLANKNFFPTGSRILIIHSGGLQGNNSLADRTLIF